jgi:DNA-binding SARP family transcriptional activator
VCSVGRGDSLGSHGLGQWFQMSSSGLKPPFACQLATRLVNRWSAFAGFLRICDWSWETAREVHFLIGSFILKLEVKLNATLQATVQRFAGIVRKRPGVAVCLCGEAGLGKSHTALEVLRLTPCRHLIVRANMSVAQIIGLLPKPDRLSSWVQRSLEQPVTEISLEVLAAVLAGLAPFVLLVEDLHEASPEALEFWHVLAVMVTRSKGVGLLATTRGDAPVGFDLLPLEPKPLEETTVLVQVELGGKPPVEALAWIQDRAAGNPLYALEHARFLARRGFLWSDGRRWRWRVPPKDLLPVTLEAMIEQELRTLTQDPEVRAVLEAFTVLEARDLVQLPLLMRVALVDEAKCAQALAMLEGARMIAGLEFRHPLYREVMTQSLGVARRQLEGRAFDALSQDDPLAASQFLGHAHVTDVQALEVLERAEVLTRAGQDAILTARMQALATRYTTGERRAQLALEAAMGLRRVSLREAIPLAELAVRECPDDPQAMYLLAELLASQGRMREVERVLERLPKELRDGPAWPERLLNLRAGVRDFSGVLELWRSHPALQVQTNPTVACHVGWALLHANDTRSASELVERIEQEGLEPEELADVGQLRAAIHFYDGDVQRSIDKHLESITVFRQVGASEKLLYALRNRANALMLLGRYSEAKLDLLAALEAANQRGDASEVCKTQVSLGGLLTDLGEYETAEDLLSEALETLERMDKGLILNQCHEHLFWLYRAWNPPLAGVLTLKHAEDALEIARTLGHARLIAQGLAILGAARASNGNIEHAWLALNEALEMARHLNEPERICVIQSLRGASLALEARVQEAIDAYREAQELARGNDLMVEEHRAGLERSRLLFEDAAVQSHLSWFKQHGLAVTGDSELGLEPAKPERDGSMRLEVLGTMRMVNDGTPVAVRGGKRQEFLALLLESRIAGRSEINKLELFDLLWPEDDEERAASSLKSLVHSIRETLGEPVIVTTPNGYALGSLSSDVEQFLLKPETNRWRGLYLEGLETRDEHAREAVYAALLSATHKLLEVGESKPESNSTEVSTEVSVEAVRTSRLLIRADPYNLNFLEVSLRALQISGNRRGLTRAFEEAQQRMLEVGESLPQNWSAFLESRILALNSSGSVRIK